MARFLLGLLKGLRIKAWGMGIAKKGTHRNGRIVFGQKPLHFLNEPLLKDALKPCCQRSFLQAAFLMRGSLSFPKIGYHLEMNRLTDKQLTLMATFLKKVGCSLGDYSNEKGHVLFSKSGDTLAKLLTLLGAQHTLLRFEEVRALRETKNIVRRRVNYESGNLARTAKAAAQQTELVTEIMNGKTWRYLPDALKQAASARLHHPDLNLSELAKKLAISKSALNHRFRRLAAYA